MSINCVRCIKNERTGLDLLCDQCREEKSIFERWDKHKYDEAFKQIVVFIQIIDLMLQNFKKAIGDLENAWTGFYNVTPDDIKEEILKNER